MQKQNKKQLTQIARVNQIERQDRDRSTHVCVCVCVGDPYVRECVFV